MCNSTCLASAESIFIAERIYVDDYTDFRRHLQSYVVLNTFYIVTPSRSVFVVGLALN